MTDTPAPASQRLSSGGRNLLLSGLAGLLIGGTVVALASGALTERTKRAEVEEIVEDYLLQNPEILPQAMQVLQDRDLAKAVDANREALEKPFGSAWAGAEDGDVVLVEFFDYACGFCRKSIEDVERLLQEDKKLKVVWRELPVLGPDSEAAAQLSLAAARQGRFQPFYHALFAAGRPTPDALAQAQHASGIVASSGAPEFRKEIEKNYQLASALRATGTPTFVVGRKVLQGAVGYDALKKAIAEARS